MPDVDDPRLAAGRILLGRRLRDARLAADLLLPAAATQASISKQYLSDCERGRRLPSWPVLLELADAYGVLVVDLLHEVYPFGTRRRPRPWPPEPPPDARLR